MNDQAGVAATTQRGRGLYQQVATLRTDSWWTEPAITFVVFSAFVVYATWAALIANAHYFVDPYLSPFYSPCLSTTCDHVTIGLLDWPLSPAFLILWAPLGFRMTCYYYRKAYYRAFWLSPPACAVRDGHKRYTGETRFPLLIQNLHRYFFYAATFLIVPFLWWDVLMAFSFPTGEGHHEFGIGVGTLVLLVNSVLLTLYSLSCHSCRHLCGGHRDVLSQAPTQLSMWRAVTRLNERHMELAWVSLFGVAFADLYVRLLSMGYITDLRII